MWSDVLDKTFLLPLFPPIARWDGKVGYVEEGKKLFCVVCVRRLSAQVDEAEN